MPLFLLAFGAGVFAGTAGTLAISDTVRQGAALAAVAGGVYLLHKKGVF